MSGREAAPPARGEPPAAPGPGPDLRLGDLLVLKKGHPCGDNRWLVVRLGADIGLRCARCGRRLLAPRLQLARRLREIRRGAEIVRASAGAGAAPGR